MVRWCSTLNGAAFEISRYVHSGNLAHCYLESVIRLQQNLQRTQFDHQIDRESAHPGKQIFEKLVSSASVGELVRLVLLHYIDTTIPPLLTKNRPLFNRISSKKLNAKGGIDLTLVWDIDDADDDSAVKELLVKRLGLSPNNVTEEDGNTVKEICRAVLLRTARLGACAIASILVLMDRAQVGGGIEKRGRVGINGRSVISFK